MKLGILSDAHGNPHGLLKCLQFFEDEQVDQVYFLGDAVGYMPDWKGVFELLEKYNVICLLGNHEQMAINKELPNKNKVYGITKKLKAENIKSLRKAENFSPSMSINILNKDILLVHGAPWQPLDGYVYPNSDMEGFKSVDADAVFMGHTHHPFIKNIQGKLIVNVGSCGLPRDIGNLVSCAIYDVSENACQIYRIRQDIDSIISAYGTQLHSSVINCLKRYDDSFYGVLVNR